MNKIKQFFWLCSGSNRKLLEECPTEASKYVGVGATVLFTGIFAALASGYAFYTFTDNYYLSALLGIFWGGLIFNLDRYIVSSMRKSGNTSSEFKMALPRILLAIIISIVIAKPLELKIFEKEINTELFSMNREITTARMAEIERRYTTESEQISEQINGLKAEIVTKEVHRDNLRALANAEADGTGGTMLRNPGPIYKIKNASANKVEQELILLTATNNKLIEGYYTQQAALGLKQAEELALLTDPGFNGFAARLEALNRLTKSSSAIFLANWFIILLFIAIETAPVFVKLISQRGPYDYLLATEENDYALIWLSGSMKASSALRKKAKSLSEEEKDFLNEQLSAKLG